MVNLKQLFKAYNESGSLSSLVNVQAAVDDHAFITKSGELLHVLSFRGRDPECLEPSTLAGLTAECQSALRVFNEKFRLNTYLFKRSSPVLKVESFSDPLVQEAVKNRERYLNGKGRELYSFEAFMTVLLTPNWKSPRSFDRIAALGRHPVRAVQSAFSVSANINSLDEEVSRALRTIHQATRSFLEQTADCLAASLLTKEEAFQFFRRLLNPDAEKARAVTLSNDEHVDYFAVDSELECYRDHLRLDNYFIKVLTLKQLPSRTFADIFSELGKINADLVMVTEWNAMDPLKALGAIRARRRHAHNTKVSMFSQMGAERPYERELLFDDSKEAVVAELGECLKAVEMRGVQIGDFSFTVLVLAQSLEQAERATAEVMKAIGKRDGAMNEERYNGLNAFCAALPGGHPYNLRRQLITNENYADIVSWFQPAVGERTNDFLGAGYLAAFETEDRSLYFYNHHVQDVGHTMVLGPTGSGKSFLMNFLGVHAQQYNPRTFIFDFGGSYRWLTALRGGTYLALGQEKRTFSINPFSLEPTAANLEFLFAFSKLLIESDGYPMSSGEDRELFEAIRSIYVLEPAQRRVLTLSNTVPRKLGTALKRWTEGEQYGAWFDNESDNLTLARFQCLDFQGMDRLGSVLEPLLFYLLHRVTDAIVDEDASAEFKIALLDEAWLFFKHSVTRDYFTAALRTWRKKNAAMILATQSLNDLSGDDIFQPLISSCPTKLLLANPNLDEGFYAQVLRLNSVEVAKVRGLMPKRQFLLKREGLSKVLNLDVDAKSYWLFTTNPYEAKRRQELVNQFGLEAALEILAGGQKR